MAEKLFDRVFHARECFVVVRLPSILRSACSARPPRDLAGPRKLQDGSSEHAWLAHAALVEWLDHGLPDTLQHAWELNCATVAALILVPVCAPAPIAACRARRRESDLSALPLPHDSDDDHQEKPS